MNKGKLVLTPGKLYKQIDVNQSNIGLVPQHSLKEVWLILWDLQKTPDKDKRMFLDLSLKDKILCYLCSEYIGGELYHKFLCNDKRQYYIYDSEQSRAKFNKAFEELI